MTATPAARYSALARYLHWAVAGLIVLQFVLAQWAEHAQETGRDLHALALLANHKSVGMTVLMLGVARLLWRWRRPPPPLPDAMGRWQVRAAHAGHGLLYGLLFALPITGWLTSSASAYSVSWFNLFTFPDLVPTAAARSGRAARVRARPAGGSGGSLPPTQRWLARSTVRG
jgi:cytochrome b561